VPGQQNNKGNQKHQHRQLIDKVHAAQIEICFPVWIFFAEEVSSYFSKIE